ncbi:MAG: hypothetical protein EPO11_04575 [Gammaproteobacteria bacterium]|nr:MAG: hypothetical protein EPO11_04575 [Gammaproteobacteria bacterium]
MKLTIQLASVPHHPELVAEIWQETNMIAEVRLHEKNNFIIELYPHPTQACWSFKLDEWMKILTLAKEALSVENL